jgi:hypothetical protein
VGEQDQERTGSMEVAEEGRVEIMIVTEQVEREIPHPRRHHRGMMEDQQHILRRTIVGELPEEVVRHHPVLQIRQIIMVGTGDCVMFQA